MYSPTLIDATIKNCELTSSTGSAVGGICDFSLRPEEELLGGDRMIEDVYHGLVHGAEHRTTGHKGPAQLTIALRVLNV